MAAITVLVRNHRLVVIIIHTELCTVVVASGHVPLNNGDDWWRMLIDALSHPRMKGHTGHVAN